MVGFNTYFKDIIMYLSQYTENNYRQLDELLGDPSLVGNSIFITLRFRRRNKYGQYLTWENIEQNTNHFFHRLNTKVFGKSFTARRRRKPRNKLKHFTVCHNHKTNIFKSHIHSIIFNPLFLNNITLGDLSKTVWGKTLWGYTGDNDTAFNAQQIYDRKIIRYLFTEQNHYDSIPIALSL